MLRTDLINLLHTRDMWAFVGAGASADSGLPTWRVLLERVVHCLDLENALASSTAYQETINEEKYAHAFGLIQEMTDRGRLEAAVRQSLSAGRPGRLLEEIADLPFAGYITTNYDDLPLQAVTNAEPGPSPWIPVGNTNDEARKITGDSRRLIWHIHGSIHLPTDRSKLIITNNDYDNAYPDSRWAKSLEGLFEQRRVVFIGFGFSDHDFSSLLDVVRRRTRATRPIFAFFTATNEWRRRQLLRDLNIEVIPYEVISGSHHRIVEMLQVYKSLTVARSLRLGQGVSHRPGYDPATTGLLLYNELVLKDRTFVGDHVLELLVSARVLALLNRTDMTTDELVEDIESQIKPIGTGRAAVAVRSAVERAVAHLQSQGRIAPTVFGHFGLTPEGRDDVIEKAATAERFDDQFYASLKSRASSLLTDSTQFNAVADVAHMFLTDCLERRALGLALAMNDWEIDRQRYHMVALLQDLPSFSALLNDDSQVIALATLLQDVLSLPTDAEKQYVGVVLQARFANHLLGHDADTLEARVRDVRDTVFIVDSYTLIPYLSVGSDGHEAARLLIDQLHTLQSKISTTRGLCREVARHANWALSQVDMHGFPNEKTLSAMRGEAGESSNLFLNGFIFSRSNGGPADFPGYIRRTCRIATTGRRVSVDAVASRLDAAGIQVLDIDDLVSDDATKLSLQDLQEEIALRRIELGTYKGPDQTEAEARVIWLIRGLRDGVIDKVLDRVSNAYFVSPSRVVDRAAGGRPVTMNAEALRQWITTLVPRDPQDLQVFTTCLLHELAEGGIEIVKREQLLTTFGPIVRASEDAFEEHASAHHDLVDFKYGHAVVEEFRELDPLRRPTSALAVMRHETSELRRQLRRQLERAAIQMREEKLSAEEKARLARLESEKKARIARHSRKKKKKKKNRR